MKNVPPILISIAIFFVLAGTVIIRQKREAFPVQKEKTTITPTSQTKISPTESTVALGFQLNIIEPLDGSTLTKSEVIFEGKTFPDAMVVINDTELQANAQGFFSVTVSLDEGENIISITAYDQDGNFAEKDITLIYNPEENQ